MAENDDYTQYAVMKCRKLMFLLCSFYKFVQRYPNSKKESKYGRELWVYLVCSNEM